LVDGLLSLVHSVGGRLWGIQPLSVVQALAAFVVLLTSFVLYFLMGCMRGFPKKVVLPLVVFTVWVGFFAALPLPIFLGMKNMMVGLSLLQTGMGIGALILLRVSVDNRQWLYGNTLFDQLAFRWKRLAGFLALNIFLIGPLLGLYLVGSLSIAVSHHSNGFIQIGFQGVSVESRTYHHMGKSVLLLPTAHIAQKGFYDQLIDSLPATNSVIIPEGTTDRNKLLSGGLGYEKLAESMGLEAQDNKRILATRNEKRCDMDISEFSDETIDLLQACSELFRGWPDGDRVVLLQNYLSTPNPDFNVLHEDLLTKRNRRVTDCIAECVKTFDHIVVPWGAMHMPGIERTMLEQGATVESRKRILVLGWRPEKKELSR
jgi:hypothetical protein